MKPPDKDNELRAAISAATPDLTKLLVFSFFVNMLVLVPTVYMMEVYDRVVNSRSEMTLLMLTVIALFAYAVMEALEWSRHGILQEMSERFDRALSRRVFDSVFLAGLLRGPAGGGAQPLNDLRALRDFFVSPAAAALLDVPMSLVFLLILYLIHPLLFLVSFVAALIQLAITYATERSSAHGLNKANRAMMSGQNFAAESLRNAEVIEALGMQRAIHRRWLKRQNEMLTHQAIASDKAGGYSAISRVVQQMVGSLILGLSVWLTIKGEFGASGGMMIVAMVLGGRAVQPIVQAIASWKLVVGARDAYARLGGHLQQFPARAPGMPLPPPKGLLLVEQLTAGAPGSPVPILRNLSFQLPVGGLLAVIGPSASGKSSLARLLTGIWPAMAGKVRLDGMDVFAWNKSQLGPYVGYLPQEVELFEGTLAENIARFGEVDMQQVKAATETVGLHEVIAALPNGYDTNIGDEGAILSGGQRQRVGLARAIYGNPRFVVLDEPNSSLDEAGENRLIETLRWLKSRSVTVVVITHRPNLLQLSDGILVLQDGMAKAIGPRDEVLAALMPKPAATAATTSAASPQPSPPADPAHPPAPAAA